MVNFASLCNCASAKDSSAINMDMVKPIPANWPIPHTCTHFTPSASLDSFSFTASQLNRVIPIGLPNNKLVEYIINYLSILILITACLHLLV